ATALPNSDCGLAGRALRAGDVLGLENSGFRIQDAEVRPFIYAAHWSLQHRPAYSSTPTLRVVAGPHDGYLAEATLAAFYEHSWTISATSNRMGYRLTGPTLPYVSPPQIVSFGVVPGVVQLPPDGQPIVLMADAQTTGGYPVIAAVIGPDLPLAAQLLPGDALQFRLVTLAEAYSIAEEAARWQREGLDIDEGMFQLALTGGGSALRHKTRAGAPRCARSVLYAALSLGGDPDKNTRHHKEQKHAKASERRKAAHSLKWALWPDSIVRKARRCDTDNWVQNEREPKITRLCLAGSAKDKVEPVDDAQCNLNVDQDRQDTHYRRAPRIGLPGGREPHCPG
ncbi:hypothetical protein HC891_19400, partial [Candidatus Gracilibacteria bacterium]|nr:hypothetical protein [Candidatus Gracilibacteria bacterium]